MKLVSARWQPYTLRFRKPWITSRGVLHERTGHLLRLESADCLVGWGDCAPLKAFGIDDDAAGSFAEESAHLDLVAQKAELPLNAWLSGAPPVCRIGVNTHLGNLLSTSAAQVNDAKAQGFAIAKLKVGVGSVKEEIAALHRLAAALTAGSSLRLDANAAWTLVDAGNFIDACAGLPIEGLEEPLAEPEFKFLEKLQSTATFPLAIDESVYLFGSAFFAHPPVRRIVIKPARQGGLLASLGLALRAQASGIETVFTSCLESSCGLLACAHLAAAVAPDAVHGLATADWFANDVSCPAPIEHGHLQLPDGPGLGFHYIGA